MQSRALIVTGMHRSGTSLITNWLYSCGLQVGEKLVEANTSNKNGHFEDVEFLKLHEEILAGNGFPATGLIDLKDITISDYQMEKLKAVLHVKQQRFEQWGWKEPRTCLFLDTYRELLPDAKYLVILRDYKAVVNSLLKRDFDNNDKSVARRSAFTRFKWTLYKRKRRYREYYAANAANYLKVWINYNERILDMLQKLPEKDYLVVNYSLLEKDDSEVFAHLTDTWDFKLEYFPFREVYDSNLISAQCDLGSFLKDESLIKKAAALEKEFEKYMGLNS